MALVYVVKKITYLYTDSHTRMILPSTKGDIKTAVPAYKYCAVILEFLISERQ